VTHINADQHGALLREDFGELQVVKVAASLRVDLSQDVGGLRQIELVAVPEGDDLGRNVIPQHHLLEHLVGRFSLQHAKNHRWVAELAVSFHVVLDLAVKLLPVRLLGQLDPVGLFDLKAELLRRLAQVVVDIVGDSENSVVIFVDHDPPVLQQVRGLVDRSLAEGVVVALHDLIVRDHLWSRENLGTDTNRLSLNLNRPVLDCFLVEEGGDHVGDPLQLGRCECGPERHACQRLS
jgi:hypothetical protein